MTNLDAIRALCTKICTGFYPDKNVLEFTLIDNGIEATEPYKPKNVKLVRLAIGIVKGMAENSHSESGISDSWDREAIEKNIAFLCKEYGMDSSEFVDEPSITDGSNQW
jgi:hypothetical protein